MLSRKRQFQVDNPWDYRLVPEIPYKDHRYSADKAIKKIIRSTLPEHLDLKIQLKRARQLAYVEPWFQDFLPTQLKEKLFIASLGRVFWQIIAVDSLSASMFKFYQKEIRQTLENHLNVISSQSWSVPEFSVKVAPPRAVEEIAPVIDDEIPDLAVRSNKRLVAVRSTRSLEEILSSMMETAQKNG